MTSEGKMSSPTQGLPPPLASLKEEARALVVPRSVERIASPTSLAFTRDYVSRRVPVVITGALGDWKALKSWDLPHLSKAMGEQTVTVDFTPNGRGDSVTADGELFVTPAEKKLKFRQFVKVLQDRNKSDGVAYCQHQNGSFTTEFGPLHRDVKELSFAREAFGQAPDAVNMWVGDERSISSLHRDPYENIYCVVKGTKRFTLLPPTDCPYLGRVEFECAHYEKGESGFQIVRDYESDGKTPRKVPWIPVDPDFPNRIPASHRCLRHARPEHTTAIRVDVKAGEILYLPSLWYHQVSQVSVTIAVNYWYDMHFGLTWSLSNYLEEATDAANRQADAKAMVKGCSRGVVTDRQRA